MNPVFSETAVHSALKANHFCERESAIFLYNFVKHQTTYTNSHKNACLLPDYLMVYTFIFIPRDRAICRYFASQARAFVAQILAEQENEWYLTPAYNGFDKIYIINLLWTLLGASMNST
jgi:hypothetical protein